MKAFTLSLYFLQLDNITLRKSDSIFPTNQVTAINQPVQQPSIDQIQTQSSSINQNHQSTLVNIPPVNNQGARTEGINLGIGIGSDTGGNTLPTCYQHHPNSSTIRNKTPLTAVSNFSAWSQELHLMRVIVNPGGRFIFLALTLTSLVVLGLVGATISTVPEPHRWLPAIGAVLAGLAFLLLMAAMWFAPIYCLRLINVSFLALMAIAAGVVDGMLFQRIGDPSIFIVISISILVVYLIAMAIILLPDPHSDFAHRFHPFIADVDINDITITGSKHKHGRRRIKHREVSIFEDWPAPVPFPAQALYTYRTNMDSELSFHRGDQLIILDCRGNWWQAKHPKTHKTGFVPSNYIQVLQKGRVVKTFESKDQDEVTILEGQEIEVMEIHEHMSLVRNVDGKIGSVPTDCIHVDPINLTSLQGGGE